MADINASIHFLLLIFFSSTFLYLKLLNLVPAMAFSMLSSWVGLDCCRWSGVVCSQRVPRVIKLKLRNQYARSPDANDEDTGAFEDDYGAAHAFGGEISHSLLDLKDLRYLDLEHEQFEGLQIPKFIGSFKRLRYLNLSGASFGGTIPPHLGNLSSLLYLDLNSYSLESVEDDLHWLSGHLPRDLGKLCNLRTLKLSFNSISRETTEFMDGLSECVNSSSLESLDLGFNYKLGGFLPNSLGHLKNLKSLHLWSNSFVGSILNSIGNLSSLQGFYISENQMNGIIPESVGQLSALVALDHSENPWVGVMTESHFSNLTSLTELAIKKSSPNITLVFNVNSKWIPPFKLNYLELRTCQLGHKFPAWLRTQNQLKTIVLNNARFQTRYLIGFGS
ncbi:putative leucine-rich repeat receptor-like protein kinase [Vitis vinifera]|uniref:Putative leucine-rich repeat receptor-like protein kinase n=1 Tax=Vitis vinifera TaxID=29760 RepID=A0A438H6Z1_VITVI|nr:putative leucine-rich repeat receptor-like protein kinase [Vitis vinifera]